MKALSVQQPFASEIASGSKWVEWRKRRTHHRGDLLICSSKSPKGQGPAGVALAVVEVVDCRPDPDIEDHGWCLDRLRRVVRPFPISGRLGLYDVELPPGCRLARVQLRPPNWWEIAIDMEGPESSDGPEKMWTF